MQLTFPIAVSCALLLSGCNSVEGVQFTPSANQTAIVRDGVPALVSRRDHSVVLLRPSQRGEPARGRVVFIVAINNLTRQPVDFHVSDISASQVGPDGSLVAMQVIPYEQLASEERSR